MQKTETKIHQQPVYVHFFEKENSENMVEKILSNRSGHPRPFES